MKTWFRSWSIHQSRQRPKSSSISSWQRQQSAKLRVATRHRVQEVTDSHTFKASLKRPVLKAQPLKIRTSSCAWLPLPQTVTWTMSSLNTHQLGPQSLTKRQVLAQALIIRKSSWVATIIRRVSLLSRAIHARSNPTPAKTAIRACSSNHSIRWAVLHRS